MKNILFIAAFLMIPRAHGAPAETTVAGSLIVGHVSTSGNTTGYAVKTKKGRTVQFETNDDSKFQADLKAIRGWEVSVTGRLTHGTEGEGGTFERLVDVSAVRVVLAPRKSGPNPPPPSPTLMVKVSGRLRVQVRTNADNDYNNYLETRETTYLLRSDDPNFTENILPFDKERATVEGQLVQYYLWSPKYNAWIHRRVIEQIRKVTID